MQAEPRTRLESPEHYCVLYIQEQYQAKRGDDRKLDFHESHACKPIQGRKRHGQPDKLKSRVHHHHGDESAKESHSSYIVTVGEITVEAQCSDAQEHYRWI